MDNLLVWGGDHTLSIDFNDPVSHADASSLGYSPSHEAADLSESRTKLPLMGRKLGGGRTLSFLEPSAPSTFFSEKLP